MDTQMDGRTDALTNNILLGTFYVQESVSKQRVYEKIKINFIFSLLAPFLFKWGLFCNSFWKTKFKETVRVAGAWQGSGKRIFGNLVREAALVLTRGRRFDSRLLPVFQMRL